MKKKFILSVTFVFLFYLNTIPVTAISELHTDGRWIKNETGDIVYLRGVNRGQFHTNPAGWWCPINNPNANQLGFDPDSVKENLDLMKAWGINVIRLYTSMSFWKWDTPDRGQYEAYPGIGASVAEDNCTIIETRGDGPYGNHRQHIKDIIQWAGERGIYIVYTPWCVRGMWNPLPGHETIPWSPYLCNCFGGYNDECIVGSEDEFADFWRNVSQELGAYPNVIFELFNEPHGAHQDVWYRGAQKSINAIRATGSDNLIVVQWDWGGLGPYGRSCFSWVDDEGGPFTGGDIVYSTHVYWHTGQMGGPSGFYPVNYEDVNTNVHYWFDDYVNRFPIWIGEFGIYNTSNPNNVESYTNFLKVLNEMGIGYAMWEWYIDPSEGVRVWGLYMPDGSPGPAGEVLINAISNDIDIPTTTQSLFSGRLKDINNNPLQSDITIYQTGSSISSNTVQTDNGGDYSLMINDGIYDIQYNLLEQSFYLSNFFIKLLSIDISSNIQDLIDTITDYPSLEKIVFTTNILKTQVIQTHSPTKPKRLLINETFLTEVNHFSDLINNTWYYDSNTQILNIMVSPNIVVIKDPPVTTDLIFEDGFESGDFSAWTSQRAPNQNEANVNKIIVNSGTYAANFSHLDGINADTAKIFDSSSEIYVRFYWRTEKLDDYILVMDLKGEDGATVANINVLSNGNVRYELKDGTSSSYPTGWSGYDYGIMQDNWYCFEAHWKKSSIDTFGGGEIWVNGISGGSDFTLDTHNHGNVTKVNIGINYISSINTFSVFVDDVAISNTYIGC